MHNRFDAIPDARPLARSDHIFGIVLGPLGRPSCIRVSMGHSNTADEVLRFLGGLEDIIASHQRAGTKEVFEQ